MIVATIHEVSSDKIEKFVDTAESWLTGRTNKLVNLSTVVRCW
jgi:hypothetical protein